MELPAGRGYYASAGDVDQRGTSRLREGDDAETRRERHLEERGRSRERRTVREVKKRISDRDVEDAMCTLRESSRSRRSRSLSCHSARSEPSPSRHQRYYDWNTTHFFPDVIDFDETGAPYRFSRRYSFSNSTALDGRRCAEEQLARDLKRYDQQKSESVMTTCVSRREGNLGYSQYQDRPTNSQHQDRPTNRPVKPTVESEDSASSADSPKVWTKSPLHVKKKRRDERRPSQEILPNNEGFQRKEERLEELERVLFTRSVYMDAEQRHRFIEERTKLIKGNTPPRVPMATVPSSTEPRLPPSHDTIRFMDDSDAEVNDVPPEERRLPPWDTTSELNKTWEAENGSGNRSPQPPRTLTSSFENLYDEADLSVNVSHMNQVELYEHQRRKQAYNEAMEYQRRLHHGECTYRDTRHDSSDAALIRSSPPYIHEADETGSRSGTWYVPKQDTDVDQQVDRPKLDAKKLVEEESKKYEDYKREYVRRISENGSEDSHPDNATADRTIALDDYEYILHKIHHEQHQGVSPPQPMTLTYVTRELSPRMQPAHEYSGFTSSEDSAFTPVHPMKDAVSELYQNDANRSFSTDDSSSCLPETATEFNSPSNADKGTTSNNSHNDSFSNGDPRKIPFPSDSSSSSSVTQELHRNLEERRRDEEIGQEIMLSVESQNVSESGEARMFGSARDGDLSSLRRHPQHRSQEDLRHIEQPVVPPMGHYPVNSHLTNPLDPYKSRLPPTGQRSDGWQLGQHDPHMRVDAHGGHPSPGPLYADTNKHTALMDQQRHPDPRGEQGRRSPARFDHDLRDKGQVLKKQAERMMFSAPNMNHQQPPRHDEYHLTARHQQQQQQQQQHHQQQQRRQPQTNTSLAEFQHDKSQAKQPGPHQYPPAEYNSQYIESMRQQQAMLADQLQRERLKPQKPAPLKDAVNNRKPANVGRQESVSQHPQHPQQRQQPQHPRKAQHPQHTQQLQQSQHPQQLQQTQQTQQPQHPQQPQQVQQPQHPQQLQQPQQQYRMSYQEPPRNVSPQQLMSVQQYPKSTDDQRLVGCVDKQPSDYYKELTRPTSKMTYLTEELMDNYDYMRHRQRKPAPSIPSLTNTTPSQTTGERAPETASSQEGLWSGKPHLGGQVQGMTNASNRKHVSEGRPSTSLTPSSKQETNQPVPSPLFGQTGTYDPAGRVDRPHLNEYWLESKNADGQKLQESRAQPRYPYRPTPELVVQGEMDQRAASQESVIFRTGNRSPRDQRRIDPNQKTQSSSQFPPWPHSSSEPRTNNHLPVNRKFDAGRAGDPGTGRRGQLRLDLHHPLVAGDNQFRAPGQFDPRPGVPKQVGYRTDDRLDSRYRTDKLPQQQHRHSGMQYYRASPDQIPTRQHPPGPAHQPPTQHHTRRQTQAHEWPLQRMPNTASRAPAPRQAHSLPRGIPAPQSFSAYDAPARPRGDNQQSKPTTKEPLYSRPTRPSSQPEFSKSSQHEVRTPPHQDDWRKTMESAHIPPREVLGEPPKSPKIHFRDGPLKFPISRAAIEEKQQWLRQSYHSHNPPVEYTSKRYDEGNQQTHPGQLETHEPFAHGSPREKPFEAAKYMPSHTPPPRHQADWLRASPETGHQDKPPTPRTTVTSGRPAGGQYPMGTRDSEMSGEGWKQSRASKQYEQHIRERQERLRAEREAAIEVIPIRSSADHDVTSAHNNDLDVSFTGRSSSEDSPAYSLPLTGQLPGVSRSAQGSSSRAGHAYRTKETSNVAHLRDQMFSGGLDQVGAGRQDGVTGQRVSGMPSQFFAVKDDQEQYRFSTTPSSAKLDEKNDVRLLDYVSYRDGLLKKTSNIIDPLTELERAYEEMESREDQHQHHYDPRPYAASLSSAQNSVYGEPQPNVKRLSIENIRRLEELQNKVAYPCLDYTKEWVAGSTKARSQSGSDVSHLDDPTFAPPLASVVGDDQWPSLSAYPRKVKDDMAYRKYNSGSACRSDAASVPSLPPSRMSPASSTNILHASSSSAGDYREKNSAYRTRQRSISPSISQPSVLARPSPTSADYLAERVTPAARAQLRSRPDKVSDKYHDDMAYKRLRKDVAPVKVEVSSYSYYKMRTGEEPPVLVGDGTTSQKDNMSRLTCNQPSDSPQQDLKDPQSMEQFPHETTLLMDPAAQSQSTPDLTGSDFAKSGTDRRAYTNGVKTGRVTSKKLNMHRTVKTVKARSVDGCHASDSGLPESESDGYSSTGAELHQASLQAEGAAMSGDEHDLSRLTGSSCSETLVKDGLNKKEPHSTKRRCHSENALYGSSLHHSKETAQQRAKRTQRIKEQWFKNHSDPTPGTDPSDEGAKKPEIRRSEITIGMVGKVDKDDLHSELIYSRPPLKPVSKSLPSTPSCTTREPELTPNDLTVYNSKLVAPPSLIKDVDIDERIHEAQTRERKSVKEQVEKCRSEEKRNITVESFPLKTISDIKEYKSSTHTSSDRPGSIEQDHVSIIPGYLHGKDDPGCSPDVTDSDHMYESSCNSREGLTETTTRSVSSRPNKLRVETETTKVENQAGMSAQTHHVERLQKEHHVVEDGHQPTIVRKENYHSHKKTETVYSSEKSFPFTLPVHTTTAHSTSFDLSEGEMTDATDITLDALVQSNLLRPFSPDAFDFEVSSHMSHQLGSAQEVITTQRAASAEMTTPEVERRAEKTSQASPVVRRREVKREIDSERRRSIKELVDSFEEQCSPFMRSRPLSGSDFKVATEAEDPTNVEF